MTSRDKPKRPGAKPFDRDRKPRDGAGKPDGRKPFGAGAKAAGFAKSERGSSKPQGSWKDEKRDFGKKAGKSAPAAAASPSTGQEPERISKLLARAGVASRRDIERMIMDGRVSVNGVVLDTPVVNVTFSDQIEVDGVPIRGIERTRLWLYHKPGGLVTTNADPEGRPTVFEHLPEDLPRVMSVGRLDINTEGLLLLTNDGGLARVLELPTTGWLRRYRVRAHGKIDQEALDRLKDGIAVDGVLYGGIEATLDKVQGSNVWITMGLREGKNREVKNVLGALGLEVNRLIRISFGPFQLGDLPEGQALEVRGRTLRDQLGPRLIEDAKANFEAPLFEHQHDDREEAPAHAQKGDREERQPFREKDGDRREKARARLDTKRDDRFGDKRDDKHHRDRDDDRFSTRPKHEPGNRARKSNVWMAPGARPVAEKKPQAAEGEEAVKRTPRDRPEGAPKTKRYGRTRDGEATKTKHKFDPDRKKPGGRFEERGDRDRNRDSGGRGPRVLGAGDEGGEWIRASEPEAQSRDDRGGGFGRPRSGAGDARAPRDFGDRAGRDDRKPRGKPFGDRGGDKPFGKREDRPFRGRENDRGERSFGDRPSGGRGGERSFGDRPSGNRGGERSFGDKPSGGRGGERSFGGKPGGKSFGGKPSFGKPAGGRPGGKPGGGRPAGKPGGGRPTGGKPRGRGN